MKSKIRSPKTVFRFWKDNRTDQEFQLTAEEFKTKFSEWMKTKEVSWLKYYSDQLVPFFIADATGLSSVFEMDDVNDLSAIAFDVKWKHLHSVGIE